MPSVRFEVRVANRRSLVNWWLLAVALLLLAAWRLVAALRDPAVGHRDAVPAHWLFSGDFLAPAVFWQDRAAGLPVRGAAFSGATFAVPELVTFAAARAVAPRPAAAVALWHAGSVLLAVIAIGVGLRGVAPAGRRPFVGPLVLLLAAAWAGWVAAHGLTDLPAFELLLPMYHVGAVVNGMGLLALVAGWLRGGGRWRLAVAGLLVAAAVPSDRLAGPWVLGPLLGALAVVRLLAPPGARRAGGVSPLLLPGWRVPGAGGGRPPREEQGADAPRSPQPTLPVRWIDLFGLTLLLAGGAWIGLRLLRWVNPDDLFGTYYSGPRWATVLDRGPAVLGQLGRQLVAGDPLLVASAGSGLVGVGVLIAAARRGGADRSGPVFLAAFHLLQWAGAVTAVTLSNVEGDRVGTVPWETICRYFIGPLAVGYFGWAVWLAGRRTAWLVVGVAVAAVGWAWSVPRSPTLDLWDYRPPYLRLLDDECGRRGLTCGLAGYWAARPVAVLSHAGLAVEQVVGDPRNPAGLTAFPWLSHPGRFDRPPGYEFVVLLDRSDDDPVYHPRVADAVAALGEPAERVPLGGYTLLVYGRPEDDAVREFASRDPVLASARWRVGADTLELPGWFLRPADPGAELVACGPYLRLPPGRYRATFRVDGADAAGWVDVHLDEPAERLLAQVVPAGFRGELGGEFEVRRRGPQRLAFRAAGRLTLRGVRLERVH